MASSSDPVTRIGDACRRAYQAFSFSLFRGREETGTHLLHIREYSTIENNLPHGRCIESPKFRAGGHTWTVEYYPNGFKYDKDGHASIVVKHHGISFLGIGNYWLGDKAGATATLNVRILDHAGNEAYMWPKYPKHYERRGNYTCLNVTGTAEERRENMRLDKEDSIFVKCEINVQKKDKESRIKMFLRGLLD
ncbi:hypothetical protein QOZ80_9BG0715080 [Eleusine coracana subsp. coracana]|nr:hypothetical protein QOZ80_9BG0715080 [Eleusine coracana subsp. coracana]